MEELDLTNVELTREILRLRKLKEDGKFNLQQSEYALTRLANKLVNIWRVKPSEDEE